MPKYHEFNNANLTKYSLENIKICFNICQKPTCLGSFFSRIWKIWIFTPDVAKTRELVKKIRLANTFDNESIGVFTQLLIYSSEILARFASLKL